MLSYVLLQAFYVLATFLVILGGMSRGGFTLWEPMPSSFNGWFGHHLFYYSIWVYDVVSSSEVLEFFK